MDLRRTTLPVPPSRANRLACLLVAAGIAMAAGIAEPGDSGACREALARGLESLERGDAAAAAERYEEAVELAPSDDYRRSALVGLGTSLSVLGRSREAVETFERALVLAPDDVDLLILLGGVERTLGRLAASRLHLQRAAHLSPGRPAPHHELGLTLTAAGDYAEAAASCRRATAIAPNSVPAWVCVGVASFQARLVMEAVEAFARAVELAPENGGARYGLARSLLAAGRRDDAIEQYVKLRALAPDLAAELYRELFPATGG